MATKDLNKQMMKPMSQWTMWLEMNDKQFKILLVGVAVQEKLKGYAADPNEQDRFNQLMRDKKEKQVDKNLIGFIAQT